MKIYNAKVVGFRRGISKAGKPYCMAHITYDEPSVTGLTVATVFVPEPTGSSLRLDDNIDVAVTFMGGQTHIQYLSL